MRPSAVCHCELIPRIENQTEIIIAQHIRERSHPFNTARIVNQSLTNSKLLVDYAENFENHSHQIDSETAILFPSKSAIELKELPRQEHPKKLLLLDGTWNQAKRMYRKWPAIHRLPHYKLSPNQPGQYRIRLEPDDLSLSTVEATVMALNVLEPELENVDQLLKVFETMVQRQLAHPSASYDGGANRSPTLNIPRRLLTRSNNLVLAYGEAAPVRRGSPKKIFRLPALWVAKRISTGEEFCCPIQTQPPVDDSLLQYFDLTAKDFQHAVSVTEFRDRWQQFTRPDDILIVFSSGSLRLLRAAKIATENAISLQSVNYDLHQTSSSLSDFLTRNDVPVPQPDFRGRSGIRLANLHGLVLHLQKTLTQLSSN
jgi:DTW domain-containing protein YfiP